MEQAEMLIMVVNYVRAYGIYILHIIGYWLAGIVTLTIYLMHKG